MLWPAEHAMVLKSFDNPSTDDIEVRILGKSDQILEENSPLELIELFVFLVL